jgi:hypothetical protein
LADRVVARDDAGVADEIENQMNEAPEPPPSGAMPADPAPGAPSANQVPSDPAHPETAQPDSASDTADSEPAQPDPDVAPGHPETAQPESTPEDHVTTGYAEIDTALRRLDELDGLPVEQHGEVYDELHGRLRDALTAAATPASESSDV